MLDAAEDDKIRVLVVDDSSLMRKIIATALSKHPSIEIVCFAKNGLEAIDAVEKYSPDVVTLDIEMPEMDGLAALREIRKKHQKLPIIMFSTLTQKGAQATVVALTRGASDYVEKPSNSIGGMDESFRILDAQLIPKVLGLAKRAKLSKTVRTSKFKAPEFKHALVPERPVESTPKVVKTFYPAHAVCIGVSTGGPVALMELFSQFTSPLSVPIFIVQHIPPSFTALLAARLSTAGAMTIKEPVQGEEAVPGVAYLAPGGQHMVLRRQLGRTTIHMTSDPAENSCRPAVDVLFRSAADVYGQHLLAVVMTGMGYDGLKGCHYVNNKLGQVIVQDEESSVIWGMPGAVVGADAADAVFPLNQLGSEIINRAKKQSRYE